MAERGVAKIGKDVGGDRSRAGDGKRPFRFALRSARDESMREADPARMRIAPGLHPIQGLAHGRFVIDHRIAFQTVPHQGRIGIGDPVHLNGAVLVAKQDRTPARSRKPQNVVPARGEQTGTEAKPLRAVVVTGNHHYRELETEHYVGKEMIEQLHRLHRRDRAVEHVSADKKRFGVGVAKRDAKLVESIPLLVQKTQSMENTAEVPVGGVKESHKPLKMKSSGTPFAPATAKVAFNNVLRHCEGMKLVISLFWLMFSLPPVAMAEEMPSMEGMHHHHQAHAFPLWADQCSEMEYWDYTMGMCMPMAMAGMSMSHWMVMGNAFLTGVTESGPRGRSAVAVPDMVMGDVGRSLGDRNFLNLSLMATAEKWLYPSQGYPLLLQIGETQADGAPFLDAQHPHSSPIMGLTLSDTITLDDDGDYLSFFFAPRGQTTDGPTAFMHRATGMVNPDAPLGHHIGQDVGHVTSTVIGASFKWGHTIVQVSTFHGAEPEPTQVDLPIGAPDSVALRIIEQLSPTWGVLASAAYVQHPEPDEPSIASEMRYSASTYFKQDWFPGGTFYDWLIFGAVTNYDQATSLLSFNEEGLLDLGRPRVWTRIELLQRTPGELEIAAAAPNDGQWVSAFTLGASYVVAHLSSWDLSFGASFTQYVLPSDYTPAYGGNPWAAKAFLELGGMSMGSL